jgi:hypothetical protein
VSSVIYFIYLIYIFSPFPSSIEQVFAGFEPFISQSADKCPSTVLVLLANFIINADSLQREEILI